MHSHVSHNNQAHFDKKAHEYDATPGAVQLTSEIAHAILSSYPFDGTKTDLMEFACGTGLVAMHLAPHVRSLLGVDISQGMIDRFNARHMPNARGVRTELGVDDDDEGDVQGPFDVIVCSMAYHHMEDIASTTRMLVDLLAPSGVLFVADLVQSPKPLNANEDTVPHRHGFSTDAIQSVFHQSGLRDVSIQTGISTPDGMFMGAQLNVFIAQGTK